MHAPLPKTQSLAIGTVYKREAGECFCHTATQCISYLAAWPFFSHISPSLCTPTMARLSAGIAWAVVLWFIMLGISVSPGNGDLLDIFGSLPPMRIISKQTKLSLAIRNNTVVLATTDVSDRSQLWVQDYYSFRSLLAGDNDGCSKPFALVNVGTGQAMVAPEKEFEPMLLAQYNPFTCVPLSMLWTKGTPVRDDFYQIKMFRDESKAFNAVGGYLQDGTVIGWGAAGPIIGDNTLTSGCSNLGEACIVPRNPLRFCSQTNKVSLIMETRFQPLHPWEDVQSRSLHEKSI
ncbi:hypothetical protein EJB05_34780 [Eragrostis curvula]|uniref:Uncharacterized protein n=1 Tax=Eragrostis curvula TaxID=38414 RepID=A0A5J9U6D2_9POAL|nr:hypothetical protein EJB05_34780 [Eragrostis curvula]